MYDLDAIEAINIDQLVTATDRVLFGNLKKGRVVRPQLAAAAHEERTVYVRDDRRASQVAMLAAAATFAWLAVGLVCLLT